MTIHASTSTDTGTGTSTGEGAPGVDRAATERVAATYHGTVVRWWTRCDRHEPSRRTESGFAVRYDSHPVSGGPGFVFWPGPQVREAHDSLYVIDDGASAVPFFVTSWSRKRGSVTLHPIPTNPEGTTRADRADEEIDYAGWAMGPTRAYHLKITPA